MTVLEARQRGRLPIGLVISVSQDGSAIAGFRPGSLAVYRPGGEEVAAWPLKHCAIALGDDASWIAIQSGLTLEKRDIATGATLAKIEITKEQSGHRLAYWDGYLFGANDVWRASDLSHAALPAPPIPLPGRGGHACGSRFVVSRDDDRHVYGMAQTNGLVLWDRVRERSVLFHESRMACLAVAGRYAITHNHEGLSTIDLVTNERCGRVAVHTRRPDHLLRMPPTGAYAVVSWGVVYASDVYDLVWQDGIGDAADVERAWSDCRRPPIVDAFLPQMTEDKPHLRAIARNHAELELALAKHMPPVDGLRWTRRALQSSMISPRPDAWHQLATIAFAAGDLDSAADAAAEGLGRDENNEALHALLARIQAALSARR